MTLSTTTPKPTEEPNHELLNRWKTIVTDCEKVIAERIEKANEPIPQILDVEINSLRKDEILRDQIWKHHREGRNSHICSRCGSYQKYSIVQTEKKIDLGKYDDRSEIFYEINYSIASEKIENKNSLGDETWYDLCKKCQDHVTGKHMYPLNGSLNEILRELRYLKNQEHKRRFRQEDQVKLAKNRITQKRKEESSSSITKPSLRGRMGNILRGVDSIT